MKIWFDVVQFDCNLLGGGEETTIGTFDDVKDAIAFETREIINHGSVYRSFQTIVRYEDTANNGVNAD